MNVPRRRSLEQELADLPAPAPPPGLAEAIKREIPEDLGALPAPRRGVLPGRHLRLAAALFLAVAGGLIGHRALRDTPPPEAPPAVTPPAPPAAVLALRPPERPSSVSPAPAPQGAARNELGRSRVARPAGGAESAIVAEPDSVPPVELLKPVQEAITVVSEAPPQMRKTSVGAVATPSGVPGAAYAPPPSTGGTAEPNDQPHGDMFFRSYGVNPFVDTEEDRLSTFGLEVDTGSFRVASAYLRDGHLPPSEAIRVEEFVNAFRYGDPSGDGDADFALRAEGAPSPFAGGERYRLLRFHLRARAVDPADRRPAVLTFVVDVSGSMAREDRLELVKRALALLLDQLRPADRVGLVVYGSRGRVVLPHTGERETLREAIATLAPEGATNAEEGLRLAYDLAAAARREGAINRVLLCSDGVANVGSTGPGSILRRIGEEARRGIELTTVGFGMGNYNDVLMEQLADRGNGRYAYVDTLREARRVFVEDLTGTLQTAAADAKAQVEFDPAIVERWRLLGYENRDIADERFRDDRVDAGEIGAGHEVTALYEVKLRSRPRRRGAVATLRLRYRPVGAEGAGAVVETARELRWRELAPSWEKASPGLRLAAVVAELAEVLKGSYWARGSSLAEVGRRAAALTADFPGDERVAELAALAARAAALATAAADGPPAPEE